MTDVEIDRHGIDCYFCGQMADERDCTPADDLNGNDGGSCCPDCRASRSKPVKTKWEDLPLDVRILIADIRAKLTLAYSGITDAGHFHARFNAVEKLREAISDTDTLMS